jgi:hypothetical protein
MTTNTITFKVGDCPACQNLEVPLRNLTTKNKMVVWLCDTCITSFNNRDKNGGVVIK